MVSVVVGLDMSRLVRVDALWLWKVGQTVNSKEDKKWRRDFLGFLSFKTEEIDMGSKTVDSTGKIHTTTTLFVSMSWLWQSRHSWSEVKEPGYHIPHLCVGSDVMIKDISGGFDTLFKSSLQVLPWQLLMFRTYTQDSVFNPTLSKTTNVFCETLWTIAFPLQFHDALPSLLASSASSLATACKVRSWLAKWVALLGRPN